MLFYLFVSSLRSLFPSTKSTLSIKPNTSSTEIADVSSSPSTQPSKRLSFESLFSSNPKTPKANIPLLSPPSSQ